MKARHGATSCIRRVEHWRLGLRLAYAAALALMLATVGLTAGHGQAPTEGINVYPVPSPKASGGEEQVSPSERAATIQQLQEVLIEPVNAAARTTLDLSGPWKF